MGTKRTKTYLIANYGCDDKTCGVFELTDKQFAFLKKLFEQLNKNSSYGCQPTIHIIYNFEKIEGNYKDKWDYQCKTDDWLHRIEEIDGNLYKINE